MAIWRCPLCDDDEVHDANDVDEIRRYIAVRSALKRREKYQTMFEATIKAETLKRVIYPLFMLNDAGIFKIDSTALTCQAANTENTEIAQAIMPAKAWDNFTHGGLATRAHTVGIDLKWIMAMLNCTPDDAIVDMSINGDRIYLNIGMHIPSRRLIDASKIRKPPKSYDQSHTARMDMQGGFFVAMIKYLAVVGAVGLEIRAYNTEYSDDARGIYGIEYLIDIAAGIQPTDKVSLRFGKDTPIEIGYEVDGCEIRHILAPRIGDEVE